jgi:hypothetical protein
MIGSINGSPMFTRSNLALLQTMQAGRAISTLLSSMGSPSDSVRPAPPHLAFTPEMQSPPQLGRQSIGDSRIAHKAYLTEIQTKGQVELWPRGNNWMNEWFA